MLIFHHVYFPSCLFSIFFIFHHVYFPSCLFSMMFIYHYVYFSWCLSSMMFNLHDVYRAQPELLKQLSDVLKHGSNSQVARMQAGIQLKNALYSKDATIRAQHQQRWMQFGDDLRNYVKRNVRCGGLVIYLVQVLISLRERYTFGVKTNIPFFSFKAYSMLTQI